MALNGGSKAAEDISRLHLNDDAHAAPPHIPATTNSSLARPSRKPVKTAIDITEKFTRASEALQIGQLVKDEQFTLFESVGALEIMDPKMDSGYLAPGETLEDEYDILRPLLPEEVLGIMDQLLCYEMAWHRGSPLSQTLFTSLYIEQLQWPEPKTLSDSRFNRKALDPEENKIIHSVLRSYCLALLKTCGFVHELIKNEHFYEEEDFVGQLYNRDLLSNIPQNEILETVDEALSWLGSDDCDVDEKLKTAMLMRLEFRKAFLNAVATNLPIAQRKSIDAWQTCSSLLTEMKSSQNLGKSVPESFSVKIQRKLASTVPPRPIVDLSFEDAFLHLETLCRNSVDIRQVLDYRGSNNILSFVWAFQSREPQPSVYIRCLLQSILFGEMKILDRMSVKQLICDDLEEIVLPADQLLDPRNAEVEVPTDPRFQIVEKMEKFVAKAAQSYIELLRTLCQNRARIRRNLCHIIMDWENLQLDIEEIDMELRDLTDEEPINDPSISSEPIYAFPLSSWAYYHKLCQMEWIIQMGFELDIYQPDEFAGMYWYLQNLFQTRIHHLERIRGFVTRKYMRLSSPTSTEKEAFAHNLAFINVSMLQATANQALSDALSCLYTSLHRQNALPTLPRPYSTDALRYELRMKPFLHISLPELVPFEQFKALVDPEEEPTSSLLRVAGEALKRARKDFDVLSKMDAKTARKELCVEDWRKDMKDVQRACIAAGIGVMTVQKAVTATGDRKTELKVEIPRPEKGYHKWWIVPKVNY